MQLKRITKINLYNSCPVQSKLYNLEMWEIFDVALHSVMKFVLHFVFCSGMGRTLEDNAVDQSRPSYADDCLYPVTWSDAMLMTSLQCDDVYMTAEPEVGVMECNWRVVPLVVLIVAGVVGNTLVCASVVIERRLQNVTNYFLVSLTDIRTTFKRLSNDL